MVARWPLVSKGQGLREAITFYPELSFGKNYHHWKGLDGHKTMVLSKGNFEMD
jgi:hypothetical protein